MGGGGQTASTFAQFATMVVCVTLNQASAYVRQALKDQTVILLLEVTDGDLMEP